MILLDPDLEPEPAPRATERRKDSLRRNRTQSTLKKIPSSRTLARFLGMAQRAVRLRGEVNVLLTTDLPIRRLNRQFRGKDKPTDVLSFPASGPAAAGIAGDLAMSVDTARRQAEAQGHSLTVELKVLLLHGLLHLAGHDHEIDNGQMERRERRLRAQLGLPLGLIERSGEVNPAKLAKRSRS